MTPEYLEQRWLSFESWMTGCVCPVALTLLALVLTLWGIGLSGERLDIVAGSLGAVALMLVGYQGIDRMSARLVHRRLMDQALPLYRARLAALDNPPARPRDVFDLIDWLDRELLT